MSALPENVARRRWTTSREGERMVVRIAVGTSASRTVFAEAAQSGLAVTPAWTGEGWMVTHVASGAAVARYRLKRSAIAAMGRLIATGVEWRRGALTATRQFNALPDAARARAVGKTEAA